MNSLGALSLLMLLASLACGGQKSTPSQPVDPSLVGSTAATTPVAATPPVNPAAASTLLAPRLVSAGMTHILATVPVQAGASYAWTITGGVIPGATQNAAVFFTAGAVGSLTLRCDVTVAGVLASQTLVVPVQANLAATPVYYGSGFSADALANTQIGGLGLNAVSYRFQARQDSVLEAFRVFFIWSSSKTGYQAGTGGSVQVALLADDGSAAHLPCGAALASLSYGDIMAGDNFYPRLVFEQPAALQGGAIYHLVFSNLDASPSANFISLDSLYTNAQTAPMQACIGDRDWAVLVRSGAGAWNTRMGFTPILELEYGNGGRQGNGYMEVWSSNPKLISGQAGVRERFTVTGPSRSFTQVALRLQRLTGTSPLTVRVEAADGTLLEEAAVPALDFLDSAPSWVTVSFPLTQVLARGEAYHLVLSSPADTQYRAFPMRKGADKGFSAATSFPDGYAQFTLAADGGWTGWDMWGTSDLTFSDLQFMFVP